MQNYNYTIVENTTQLGVKENPYNILKTVYDLGSTVNIYLEDDTVVSPDITALADWYVQQDLNNVVCCNLMFGNCGATEHISDIKKPLLINKGHRFNSLGFIARNDQWNHYIKQFWHSERFGTTGWDWAVYKELQARPALIVLQPLCARANHIGRLNGTHCPIDLHDKIFSPIKINTEKYEGGYSLTQV